MMKYFILFIAFISMLAGVYAEEEALQSYRDPFDSVLPEERGSDAGAGKSVEETITPPSVTVEGIIWGVAMPQAIIDGEVYREGDTLKSADAKIFKIEKNVISLQYKGKIFETGIQKVTNEQEEAQ